MFSTEEKLAIVMDFNDLEGKPFYMEYPGIPVLTLINKSIEIELVYWRCSRFGTVEFDFFLKPKDFPSLSDIMFGSVVTGQLTVPKFEEHLELLKAKGMETNEVQDGEGYSGWEEIDASQDENIVVRAIFKKSGRAHDVEIWAEQN